MSLSRWGGRDNSEGAPLAADAFLSRVSGQEPGGWRGAREHGDPNAHGSLGLGLLENGPAWLIPGSLIQSFP